MRRAVTRRTVVRTGAVALALALLCGVALVVHPATRTRAVARFNVPVPLVVGDVVAAIHTHADGATATAHGRRITVASNDAKRVVARVRVVALARAGLDGARQHLIAVETRRAEAARIDRAQAAEQLATLASRTGRTDPESAYRERVAVVQNLQEQHALAASGGHPLAEIEAQLAENQRAVLKLQLEVTRHAELIQAQTTAGKHELEATRVINATKRAVGSASVQVSDHPTGFGIYLVPDLLERYASLIWAGIVVLVFAGMVFLFTEPDIRREPEAPGVSEETALAELERAALEDQGSRYLEFYRALASPPPHQLDLTSSPVDLAHEEALEESGGSEWQAAREHDGSRP